MYDPARDIFTETQPSSSPSPNKEEIHELSALDTLAAFAAEAQIAEASKQEQVSNIEERDKTDDTTTKSVLEPDEGNFSGDAGGGGGTEVARTKEPEKSLKVVLHLKKVKNNSENINNKITGDTIRDGDRMDKEERMESESHEQVSQVKEEERVKQVEGEEQSRPASPKISKQESPRDSPNESPKLQKESPEKSPKEVISPKKETLSPDSRHERTEPLYPVPLSLAKLSKIPKRKAEERPPREKERKQIRLQSPPRGQRHPRTPPRRLSDDRYRPNQLIDSYRPGRDDMDHYSPKRPRSPSPPRQLKRPVRKDVTTVDRDRERRERQLRDQQRERAELEAARSRPVYEAVRQHYNEREDRGREARQESPIFKLRKFNNWIKSVLIGKFIPERTEEEIDEGRGLFVLDIGCGKGGDLGKWQKQSQVQAYVGVDIAEVSIMHAEQRAAELRGRRFSTRFFAMDCFAEPIRSRLAPNYPLFDIISMQFVMHYAFESEEKARTMLMNVSKNLRRGGYFIGTIPSSDAIIEGIKSLPEDKKEFGNSIYTLRFPERPTQTVFRPPYGHRYNFFMEDAVGNVPEYIVPFEAFRGLAEDYNLEMVYKRTFHEVFEDEKDDEVFGRLMDRMGVKDEDGHRGIKGEEWDAAGLYLAFAFEKRGGY